METKKAGRKGESFDLFVAENELIRWTIFSKIFVRNGKIVFHLLSFQGSAFCYSFDSRRCK